MKGLTSVRHHTAWVDVGYTDCQIVQIIKTFLNRSFSTWESHVFLMINFSNYVPRGCIFLLNCCRSFSYASLHMMSNGFQWSLHNFQSLLFLAYFIFIPGFGYFSVWFTCLFLVLLHVVQLVEQFSNVWHHTRVRRYLTSEDWPGPESKGKPWYGLLMLLRKYPEHFVINTRSKGRVTLEFVSLVSLLS